MDCTTKTLMIIIIIGFLILFYMNSNLSINNSSVDTFENINTSELAPQSVASSQFENPQDYNINGNRNNLGTEQRVLDQLMQEVDTGNNFLVNSPPAEQYRQKAKSINSSDTYKAISYKDSQYRQDFGNDAESVLSKDDLNAYLPNGNLTNPKLEEGFQILNNPVSVSNPNLIPVLKSIPVSSTLGSNKNSTYDIRAEPPCPKTVVSPFLNSSIMPDIYATQRGCLA